MTQKSAILAICGSTRASSTNLSLIKAIFNLRSDFEISIFQDIASIPHFNPDLDTDNAPVYVKAFREKIKKADAVLICTPEYAMGVPGTLKNALDWTVSSCEFSHKPVALITASSMGQKAHASLLETLKIIECTITDETALLISYAKTKVSDRNEITDLQTLSDVNRVMDCLQKLIAGRQENSSEGRI